MDSRAASFTGKGPRVQTEGDSPAPWQPQLNDRPSSEVTRLLMEIREDGKSSASRHERLLELVYDGLRNSAANLLARERVGHTLQPTALVHEAWMRMVDKDRVAWTGRAHFLAVAATCMRRILVDHARERAAAKRGGDWQRVTYTEADLFDDTEPLELLALDDALARFTTLDPRAARVVEMRVFAGMTIEEIAQELRVSKRTVDGDWASAKLWLSRELKKS